MFTEFASALRPALVMLTGFTVLLGLAYPLAVTGIAGLVLPAKAGGSLVIADGKVVGSALIGQSFAGDAVFHSRPSAAGKGFDASASSGSNLAPGSKELADRIRSSVEDLRAQGISGAVPVDMVTASGSGLDPDISPAAAAVQVARVARARGIDRRQVQALVDAGTSAPLLGEPHVNVLALNRELARISPSNAAKPPV